MILITGAAGKTGQAIARALCKRKQFIRVLVHNDKQAQMMRGLGVQESIVGDMRSQETMNQAARGVRAIYHICPNVSPDELSIGQAAIRAAQSAGVGHFVYHSVLHPQVEAMPHHWQKMRVEEQLFTSGLATTILQPGPYMQNLLAYWHDMVTTAKYAVPYAADTRLSHVHLDDVADVAATVLTEPGHQGAIYELCGTDILSPHDIVETVSRYVGRRLRVEVIPIDQWEASARKRGLGVYQVQALRQMFGYYERYGLIGNARVLQALLQRAPTTFAQFVQRTYAANPAVR
ncbi:MAG: NmrA family NAD(P)-binding protein [Chloroflexi bacterium]|nr:NmrA family NAD(P)-binding protein [Chloroflexota bacterium]